MGELAEPFEMSLPGVSKHLKVLQRAGLVEQGRKAQWRPCRLQPGPLRNIADWVGQYIRHREESFERLDTSGKCRCSTSQRRETMMTVIRIDRGSTPTTTIYSEGGDLVFERTFDAPRELVWKAFMDPEIVPRWWGPVGTTAEVVEMDVRPGGTWRYVSHSPDRDDVAFYGEYLEVEPPARFKWTFMLDVEEIGPQGGPETHTFEEVDGKTTVRSVGHMSSAEAIEGALASGMLDGAIHTWDRLESLLAELKQESSTA